MSCNAVVPKRIFAVLIALAFLTGTYAAAQAMSSPKNEIYLGYSWLHPNGKVDWGQVPDIVSGGDASITHYFSNVWNLGVIADGSFHSGKGAGGNLGANVGLAMGGLQYKLHNDQLSPFVRAMVGAADLSPDILRSEWKPAIDVGGGLDLSLWKPVSIRIAQVDYIWTYYREANLTHTANNWNMLRLSAGLEFNLGYYNSAPVTAACTAQPTEVWSGDPVKVNATGANFNPKHTLTYAWTTNGGKVQGANVQSTTVDTTGVNWEATRPTPRLAIPSRRRTTQPRARRTSPSSSRSRLT